MNWHFRTIGMGTINYRRAARRLAKEVESTGLFVSSQGCDEEFLSKIAREFWKNHEDVLKARVPGFGWWIWKPEFIGRCLEQIPEGDGILYLDAGSYIGNSHEAIQEIEKMLLLASRESIVAAHGQTFVESNYSSAILMDLLGLTVSQRNSPQLLAGFLLVRNNQKGRKFVNDWRRLTCANHHEYLMPSFRSQEDNQLIHHMYDQAILSCLVKSNDVRSIPIGDKQTDGAVRAIRHRFAYGVNEKRTGIIFLYRFIALASKVRLALEHRIFRDSLSKRPSNHGI